MPLYEYECDACGQRFEVIRKFSESDLDTCTLCGKGPVRRLLSSPAIQFKGTGWYITDYARKDKDSAKSSGSSDAGGEKPAESKPASTDSAASGPSSTAAPKAEGS